MGLLDTLTGGKSDEAGDALKRAEAYYSSIQTPTAAQLTLPQLQQYVQAGILTPAEATAALQQSNAFNNINVDPFAKENQVSAINELKNVATEGGMTDEMKAQLASALNQTQTQEQGANASILDQMAQRGIPTSLMGTAAQMANAGQQAQNANLSATQAAGTAEANALNAMMNQGNLSGQLQGQQYSEAANKAAAQNAMQQWNAQAMNTANLTNAGYQQQANEYNTQNKQNVSNQNTGLSNQRTEYNAQVPETVFNNQMAKAGGMAGAAQNYGNMMQNQGNQTAGLNLGLINGVVTGGMGMMGGPGAGNVTPQYNAGAPQFEGMLPAAHGALIMDEGGPVPGKAMVPGDSLKNDRVHALLSPGEVVVPRTIAPHPEAVKNFVTHLIKNKPKTAVHPDDVHSVLEALTRRREAPIGSVRG